MSKMVWETKHKFYLLDGDPLVGELVSTDRTHFSNCQSNLKLSEDVPPLTLWGNILSVDCDPIHQMLIMDHKEILSIILLSSLGEIERPGNHCLPIYYHHFIVGYGVLSIYFDRYPLVIERKVADEYFCVLWLLSRMTSILTPLLLAFNRALAIGADVKE